MLVAFLKIPHRTSRLTDHLADMRRFIPAEHRAFLARVESLPSVRNRVDRLLFNEALEAVATFREAHLGFAREYLPAGSRTREGRAGRPSWNGSAS